MELRTLRYFVAVAEELHFGRAARRLLISQPSLSQAIRTLERRLGVRLFDRDARRVSLTAAGEDVLARARATLASAEQVVAAADLHRTGAAGPLTIGFMGNELALPQIDGLLRKFQAEYPDVEVRLQRFDYHEQPAYLLDGRAHIGVLCLPVPEDGLTILPVLREGRLVLLAADHELAGREDLTFDDLRDVPTVGMREDVPRVWRDFWRVNPRPDGSAPVDGPTANGMEELVGLVASGRCVSFAADHLPRLYPRPDVVARRVRGLGDRTLGLGWPATSAHPAVAAFGRIARPHRVDPPTAR
ncbi:LysR family transcriptional regulator [Streptomyces boninensis]|uniref:LysR family transcriptional regulator n=1 Tax=Streptomyces boninensis TaxID=2039455 RepID=UPI003B21455F